MQMAAFIIYLVSLIQRKQTEINFNKQLVIQFIVFTTFYPPLVHINRHADFIFDKIKDKNFQTIDYKEWKEIRGLRERN